MVPSRSAGKCVSRSGPLLLLILTLSVIPEKEACILLEAQVTALEEHTSPWIVIGTYSGDSLVTHMQAGGVAIAAPPTPGLNVLGQRVGVEKAGTRASCHSYGSPGWLLRT